MDVDMNCNKNNLKVLSYVAEAAIIRIQIVKNSFVQDCSWNWWFNTTVNLSRKEQMKEITIENTAEFNDYQEFKKIKEDSENES
jgi:hypothetical protein